MSAPAPDTRLFRAVGLANLLLAVAGLFAVLTVFIDDYDWDLDHELYFGQRLLAGDLLWTHEFHDKLPLLQMIMAVPAWFESVQAWRVLSLGLCLLCAFGLRIWIPRIVGDAETSPGLKRRVIDFGLLFLILLISGVPGGFTSINPAASCLAVVAMVLMLAMAKPRQPRSAPPAACFLLGGLAAATAISMRPYFVAPLAFTLLWLLIGSFVSRQASHAPRRMFVQCIGWGLAIGGFGFAMNVLPYVVAGRLDALRDGLMLIASDINGYTFSEVFFPTMIDGFHQFYIAPISICVILLFTPILFVAGFAKDNEYNSSFIHGILAAVALFTYIASQHWWYHYVHFFDAFAAYVLIVFMMMIAEGKMRAIVGRPLAMLAPFALPLVALGCLGYTGGRFLSAIERGTHDHPQTALVAEIRRYRASRPQTANDFLAPLSMYAHWRLHEGRHGFPHAANTQQMLARWWLHIGQFSAFFAPRDVDEYCQGLDDRGPTVVVLYHGLDMTAGNSAANEQIKSCLLQPASAYRLDVERRLPTDATVDFFVRK